MSSTNKTEHYSLPQFIGSDIPTWLGDFNSAMTAIDSGINAAATSASGAATDAATAQKSANDAANDAAAAQKSANDALKAANRCPFPIGYGGFFQTDPNSIYADTTWEQKKDVFILASGDTYGAGSTGGEVQHTLTEAELPEVSGKIAFMSNANKAGIVSANETTGVFSALQMSSGEFVPMNRSDSTNGARSIKFNLGANNPHNNMPPYFSMPFWIRTA